MPYDHPMQAGLLPEEALLEVRVGELPEEHPIQQEAFEILTRLCNEPLFRIALLPLIFAEPEPLHVWHEQWNQREERLEAAEENKRKEEEEKEFAALKRAVGA